MLHILSQHDDAFSMNLIAGDSICSSAGILFGGHAGTKDVFMNHSWIIYSEFMNHLLQVQIFAWQPREMHLVSWKSYSEGRRRGPPLIADLHVIVSTHTSANGFRLSMLAIVVGTVFFHFADRRELDIWIVGNPDYLLFFCGLYYLDPGKLTWNTKMEVWKMILLLLLGSMLIFRGVSIQGL